MNPDEAALLQSRYEEILALAKFRFRPLVVLWGPGPRDAGGYQKRLKIKATIESEHPHASVIFPEDPQVVSLTKKFVPSADLQQTLQAVAADLIFALDISHSVGEEIASYSRMHEVASRLIIIAPYERKKGYTGIVRQGLRVKFFSERALRSCDRASRFCREQIRAWLVEKIFKDGTQR